MSSTSAHYIEDLSESDIESLMQLLSLPQHNLPSECWLKDQSHLILTFPRTLLRPSSSLLRLAMHLPFTPAKAILCPTHKPLNPHLIRRIFLQVSAEVTTRQRRLKSFQFLDFELMAYLKRLGTINSLWMAPEMYRVAFQTQPEEPRFERVPGGCEACILASIGGDKQMLTDLRASVRARSRHNREAPRLLALLDGWIDWLGQGSELREESDRVAKAVRHVRKQAYRARKQAREDRKSGRRHVRYQDDEPLLAKKEWDDDDVEEIQGEAGDAEHDFEGSIIDYYRDVMPKTSFAEPNFSSLDERTLSMIHPAFRDSFVLNARPRSDFQRATEPKESPRQPPPISHSVYTQSLYSTDPGFVNANAINEPFLAHLQKGPVNHI